MGQKYYGSDAVSFSEHHIRSHTTLALEEFTELEKSLFCNHHSNHWSTQEPSIGAKSRGGKFDGEQGIYIYPKNLNMGCSLLQMIKYNLYSGKPGTQSM